MRITTRKAILAICAILVVGLFFSLRASAVPTFPHPTSSSSTNADFAYSPPKQGLSQGQAAKRKHIADAFQHAWNGYSKHCFGRDTLHPVSNTCEDDFGGYGATAIDALPTAIMFENEGATVQILQHIAALDWKVVKPGKTIYMFEVTIRHFAAMISAWDLLNGPFSHIANDKALRQSLYDQMVAFGDILSCAFATKSGIPGEWLNPKTCAVERGTMNNAAGVGTTILEFARLSDITKNKTYVTLARSAEEYLLKPQPATGEPFPGLISSHVSISDGSLVGSDGSWGALADSFYEYLVKAYVYDSSVYGSYLERWLLAAESTMESIGSHPYGHPEWTLLATWNGERTTKRMETLAWFAGGNFILGGMVTHNQTLVDYGLSIADAANAVYELTTTGLGGEFVTWEDECITRNGKKECDPDESIRTSDGRFRLRPEVLETWYYAWRATKDPKYRQWSWAAWEAINKYCRTDTGYSALRNVNDADGGGMTDIQESFVFAEVMKYVWLTNAEDDFAPWHVQDSRMGVKNTWVYNTEAHPIRVVGPPT